ncbi:hypothetical protein [Rubritalea sp.]|uniref:hypothetical protein n=1 Tax=Rubritalea sp. TaxID=2109375 RepID=UPI003EF1DC12
MAKLLVILSRWFGQKLLIFLVILAILLVGNWLRVEWDRLAEDRALLDKKEQVFERLKASEQELTLEMAPQIDEWNRLRALKVQAAKSEVARLEADIEKIGKEWSLEFDKYDSSEKAKNATYESYRAAQKREDELSKLVGWWQKGGYWLSQENRRKVNAYERAKAETAVKKSAYATAERAHKTLGKILDSSPIKALQEQYRVKSEAMDSAKLVRSADETRWLEEREQKQGEIQELAKMIEGERERVASNPRERFIAAVQKHLPTALWILLGIILTPTAIKLVFYYVLAPIASRFPPIRILEDQYSPSPIVRDSSVSISFEIEEGSEILVHPDFLQSSSQLASKHTQWFLNHYLPFSSITSGMCMLTRIRPNDGKTARVIVSSQNDAFGEIGAIHLPAGASMVVQPRSLAGVVKKSDEALHISRHWRLGSLHAWLTLQLRFLVFHGPCDLIVKGCRGVRADTPDPESPRMINQASTIGFSANLDYHNTRCETFISYWRGKEDLFNDLFGGENGVFVYEEMPAGGRKAGLSGRGLEGVVDTALKVFGI